MFNVIFITHSDELIWNFILIPGHLALNFYFFDFTKEVDGFKCGIRLVRIFLKKIFRWNIFQPFQLLLFEHVCINESNQLNVFTIEGRGIFGQNACIIYRWLQRKKESLGFLLVECAPRNNKNLSMYITNN